MKLRSLIVEVVTRWMGEAKLKAVQVVGDAAAVSLKGLDLAAESMAKGLERSAVRAATAMREVSAAAREVGRVRLEPREGGGAAGAAPRIRDEGLAAAKAAGRAGRRTSAGGDDLDRAISDANKQAARQAAAAARSDARMSGLASGTAAITSATQALGPFASKLDQAKAAVKDLEATVARNRKEMVALKTEALKTGDASGDLKARMQGLATGTLATQGALSQARRELREIDGGFLKAVKSATLAKVSVVALGTAFGNALTGLASGAVRGIVGGLEGAADRAIKFESSLVGISKVARGADDTAEGFERIKAGITATSKELGVLPTQVAELTAQLAPAFSAVEENGVAVDLVALTNDVTKVGVAWDITGEQAGKAFADISRGLGTTTAETKSLFGGINELGNQLGTRAADVAEAVQRSAGVLKGASISGETGAALNATLIATGASAEVAATGVRTFIARLGAGEAATKKQLSAFKALGLSATDVAKELTSGDSRRAEAQIQKVVTAIGKLRQEERLPVLIEMFGSESIGTIGAAATATDLLGKSFAIMGDKAASATSVQKEFDRVGETSAAKIGKLKANIEVLAIQLGEALLPHIDKVVEFLTSPEGQEWGRGAVEKTVGAVTTLASALGDIVGFFSRLSDSIGGTTAAFGTMGLALIALTGPYGAVLAGATALGAYLGQMYVDWQKESEETAAQVESNMADVASSLANANGVFGTTTDILVQMKDRVDESGRAWAEWMLKIVGTSAALEEFYAKDAERRGVKIEKGKKDEDKARREAIEAGKRGYAQRTQAAGVADRAAEDERSGRVGRGRSGGGSTSGAKGEDLINELGGREAAEERFHDLDQRRKNLLPNEQAEYAKLSKALNLAKSKDGGDSWTADQKRTIAEQRRLNQDLGGVLDLNKTGLTERLQEGSKYKENYRAARLAKENPMLARVLMQGRTKDENGKLSGASNEIDQALETRAEHLPGMNVGVSGARSGSGAVAGPGLSNTYNDNRTNSITQNVTVASDAATTEGRIRAAARPVAEATLTGIREAEITFIGGPR